MTATATALHSLIPAPHSIQPLAGHVMLNANTTLHLAPASEAVIGIATLFASVLRRATGFPLPIMPQDTAQAHPEAWLLTLADDPTLGEEGYELTISAGTVRLRAHRLAGLFWGTQTLRQLLPPDIECPALQPGPWSLPAAIIRDQPTYSWRGAMLDVARHFFSVADVKRYLDVLAYYKFNRFHLHLTDDQGWRLMIESWPRLAQHGGSTQIAGGAGGYYTQAEYADLVAYAAQRHILLIPEIDLPGHTNAALASYAELNADGVAPELYTGAKVGFSSLSIGKDITYRFVEDVVREVAALTPGPYLHIGGDEPDATSHADYLSFMNRVQAIVQAQGKQVIGWEEIANAALTPTTLVQYWKIPDLARRAVQQGATLIMSPATTAYLDMQYDPTTPLGTHWAAYVSLPQAYAWSPATCVEGVTAHNVVGLEAPIWTETMAMLADVEMMAFPRLLGHADIAWADVPGRTWATYRQRLATHGPRLTALGVAFYRAPEVDWA
jgi:hexosaminidase